MVLNPHLGLVHTYAGGFLHSPWWVPTGTDQQSHNKSSLTIILIPLWVRGPKPVKKMSILGLYL